MTTSTRSAATARHLEFPEQLSLLTSSELPVQFRLDRRTRERGLANIAAIRRQLAQHGHVVAQQNPTQQVTAHAA